MMPTVIKVLKIFQFILFMAWPLLRLFFTFHMGFRFLEVLFGVPGVLSSLIIEFILVTGLIVLMSTDLSQKGKNQVKVIN